MNDRTVSVRRVTKEFGVKENRAVVLKNLSFEVSAGEFVSVMGPSGCGKSTLLYLIGGLDTPTSGSILTCGYNMARLNDFKKSRIRRRDIGFVFQFYNLVQNLTVEENILLPIVMDGGSAIKYKPRMIKLLSMMGIADKLKATPSKLSGGQQQKVAIIRAVISNPGLILADEPTGNLDSRSGREVMEHFQHINKMFGITIIMVTHSSESAAYGSRIISMRDGSIESDIYKNEVII